MEKNEIIALDITGTNSEGDGIARVGADGYVVFVRGALPGENVRARVVKVSKRWAQAEAVEIIRPADVRRRPACRHFGRCGGCRLQHASYGAQCAIKSRILADALRRVRSVAVPNVIECVPSPREWGYRNKTSLPVRSIARGKPFIFGYFEEGSHRIVKYDDCPVLTESLRKVVPELASAARKFGMIGYDERRHCGDLRSIAARSGGENDSEVIGSYVVARDLSKREFGRVRDVCQTLAAKLRELSGTSLNLNTEPGNFIWGPVFKPIEGSRAVEQHIGSFVFETDISSFFQINRDQAHAMFSYVSEKVREVGASRVLELYSGVGSMSAYIAQATESVDAVEEWRPAVRLMQRCMDMNSITRVTPIESSVEGFVGDGRAKDYDTIVLDPPRTGVPQGVPEALASSGAHSVIYVSCSPATLSRDIDAICEHGGYELSSVRAFDMFPQTPHVESVTVLTRR